MTPTLSLRNPADLLAAVPYLFGFHPTDSVVLLAMRGARVELQVRADLATPPPALAVQFAELLRRHRFRQVMLVGYGPPERADPMVRVLRDRLAAEGIVTVEALRVAAGRYWSYTCSRPGCCPPDGNPYAAGTSVVAAEATAAGLVALPSRDELRARLAPVTGPAREAMLRATARADTRLAQLVDAALTAPVAPGDDAGDSAVRAASARFEAAGRVALDHALTVARAGGVLDDDAAAWLGLLLVHLPVRDHAWDLAATDHEAHQALWTDLTRRLAPDLRAGPATLLAYAAWQAGEGATSTIALEAALAADPGYTLARLLGEAINAGVSPEQWRSRSGGPAPRRPGRGG